MPFSRRQQGLYRPLVDRAWQNANRNEPRRQWQERELKAATGNTSTKHCNQTSDFDKAMAHFEAIAGDSITWNLNLQNAVLKRIRHSVGDHSLSEDDIRPIAVQAFHFSPDRPLSDLTHDQVVTITRALRIDAARATT